MALSEIDTFSWAPVACSSGGSSPSAEPALQPGQELVRMQEWPLRSRLELQALPASVRSARRHAKNMLHVWHMTALADTVELLVSELTTNAVRASAHVAHQQRETGQAPHAPQMRLWLTSDRQSVLIQVWDDDHHIPVRQDAEQDAEAGRGLLLVENLSTQWGCYAPDGPDRKIVWAVCTQAGLEPVPGFG
jgi:two-component sensor histidine kinase